MKEEEKTLQKPRKLQKIDEYRKKIPIAWRHYQREIQKGTDPKKAELKAVKAVYPKDKNSSSTLRTWKTNGLWPPSEAQEKAALTNKNGLTIINGGSGQRKLGLSALLKASGVTPSAPSELSEKEILQGVRKILDGIETRKRQWTGGRKKRYSPVKTKVIAARLPVELLNQIHEFKGSDRHHVEKALRLYVMVMGAGS
ncbi:MAG: hypothetical protein ACLP5H_12015 [Desulfomonilaceae bacterium]